MGLQMGFCIWVCVLQFSFISVLSQDVGGDSTTKGTVFVDGKSAIGIIDSDYVCATLDWWPPEKCDYGTCSWGMASLLNLDLNENLLKAIKAFTPLKIRLGGSLQDKLIYETEGQAKPCPPFLNKSSEMFGFTQACLPLRRWDELNIFFKKSGAKLIFGLNALNGRSIHSGSAVGKWDSTNAESFIQYTVKKNYRIDGWEFGNELSGSGVGVRVAADQYSSDTNFLINLVRDIYKGEEFQPQVIAPGGFFDANWFKEFIGKTPMLDVATHHIYNLGAGVDQHLVEKILDPSVLDGIADTFKQLQGIIKSPGTSVKAWVGESGGAYNSGHDLVSNAFVYSFWYLDQLGMAATYDTKTYCRQTLIGGNYGLLDTKTFVPNPDYYSALLWHRLMGRQVLSTSFSGTKKIRAYTHCAKQSDGITMLLINLDNSTTVQITPAFSITSSQQSKRGFQYQRSRLMELPPADEMGSKTTRHEYHLTAKDGNLHSQTMLLNGNPLTLTSTGDIPSMVPVPVNSSEPIIVAPFSIVFVHLPNVVLPACK